MHGTKRPLSFLLCLSLFLAASARGQPRETFELLPGIVADRALPAVYVMSPAGGIDALDATSGRLLWSSRHGDRPLAIEGDLLIAQTEPARAGVLGIAVLDRDDGGRRAALEVDLPAGVVARVGAGVGRTFDAWATVRDGEVRVGWEEVRRWAKPIPPGPDDRLETRLRGGARIDPAARTAVPLATAPERPGTPVARLVADGGGSERQPAGSVLAELHQVRQGDRRRLVLRRWEAGTGAALPEVELVDGDYHLRVPSADGRHLLVSREAASGNGYDFLVFSLETGQSHGKTTDRRPVASFAVLGDVLIYEVPPRGHRDGDRMVFEPRRLRGIDLFRGSGGWQWPVRDLEYRGPLPP